MNFVYLYNNDNSIVKKDIVQTFDLMHEQVRRKEKVIDMLIIKAKKLCLDDPIEKKIRINQAKNSLIRFLQLIVENKKC